MIVPRYRFFFSAKPYSPKVARILEIMQLLEAIAIAFFRTFGITEPTEQTRRRAAWFLLGLSTLILVVFVTLGAILLRTL